MEKQPPQVLKTQTKFQAGVRFLLGLRFLGAPAKPPLVRADMVTEEAGEGWACPGGLELEERRKPGLERA